MSVAGQLKSSRKVLVFLIVFGVISLFTWFAKIGPEVFKEVTIWGFGFLCAGNVGEHYAKRVK